jgi:hypothetical protein
LKGFLQEKIGRKFAVYPHDKQEYDDLIFDFREKKLFRGNEELLTLGAKTLPITKLLLENRGRKFTYEELAEELGEISVFKHWQTAPNYKVKLDKIFARLYSSREPFRVSTAVRWGHARSRLQYRLAVNRRPRRFVDFARIQSSFFGRYIR